MGRKPSSASDMMVLEDMAEARFCLYVLAGRVKPSWAASDNALVWDKWRLLLSSDIDMGDMSP
jgi:hypothetical protein